MGTTFSAVTSSCERLMVVLRKPECQIKSFHRPHLACESYNWHHCFRPTWLLGIRMVHLLNSQSLHKIGSYKWKVVPFQFSALKSYTNGQTSGMFFWSLFSHLKTALMFSSYLPSPSRSRSHNSSSDYSQYAKCQIRIKNELQPNYIR